MRCGRGAMVLGLLGATLLALGCETTTGGGAGPEPASLTVDYAARFNVEKAAVSVLAIEGYQLSDRTQDRLMFHNPGGNVRIEVVITPLEYRKHRISCSAFVVAPGAGDNTQARWVRTGDYRSDCRRILSRIKKVAKLL